MALVVAPLAVGCAAVPGSGSSDCPAGRTTPITTAQATAALREHGFSVRNDPDGCAGSATAVMVINNSNNGIDPDPAEDQGHVICHIDRAATGRALEIAGVWETDGTARDDGKFHLKNVTCSLYAARDREDEIRRLRAAMQALSAELGRAP